MATLDPQVIDREGIEPAYANAGGAGDQYLNTGYRTFVHAKNGQTGDVDITIKTQTVIDGEPVEDKVVVVPGNDDTFFGFYLPGHYNDPYGYVQMTYSSVTSLTIAVLRLTAT